MVQGEFGDEFFVISSGTAQVLVNNDGAEKVVTELHKNDYFGEQALLNNSKRSATICAVTSLKVLVLNRSQFQKLKNSTDVIFAKRRAVCTQKVGSATQLKKHDELSEKERDYIKGKISTNILFQDKEDEIIEAIVQHFFERVLKKGDIIIKEGDTNANEFYVLSTGMVDVIVKEKKVASLDAGKCFGELALMYKAARNATIQVSSESCTVYVMEREAYRFEIENIQQQTDEKHFGFLRSVKLLQPLLANELTLIDMALVEGEFPAKKVIFKQGDAPNQFYIVKEGSCEGHVLKEDKTEETFHLGVGQFFGELALLNDEPRNATITAGESRCKLLQLSKEDFLELLGPLKEILNRNAEEYKKPTAERNNMFASKICELDDLETIGLLGRGAFGKVTLVVDPNTKKSYALKAIKKRQIEELGQSSHIVNEKK
eukprot:UN06067